MWLLSTSKFGWLEHSFMHLHLLWYCVMYRCQKAGTKSLFYCHVYGNLYHIHDNSYPYSALYPYNTLYITISKIQSVNVIVLLEIYTCSTLIKKLQALSLKILKTLMHFLGKQVKLFAWDEYTSGDGTVVSVLVFCNEKACGMFCGS